MYSEEISKSISAHLPCPSAVFQTIYLFLHLFNKDLVPFTCLTLWMWKKTGRRGLCPYGPIY